MRNPDAMLTRRQFLEVLCTAAGYWALSGTAAAAVAASVGARRFPRNITAPIADKVAPKMADALRTLHPAQIAIGGWLGTRIDLNAAQRLSHIDLEPLLAGYRKKPGDHPWIGEHIGKWIHAASLTWARTGDAALRRKLDAAVDALIATQEADGYLGTYVPEKRFGLFEGADWDVWSTKYCLIGLLTYYRHTGTQRALQASCRAADLLIDTFPSKRSILQAGTHRGMAATSVLEPVVLLHRLSGEPRYLAFAAYIVDAWQEDGGPDIVDSLHDKRKVQQVANGKAYEMLSNLVGLCEFARVTGDRRLIDAVLIAWQDIVDTQLYVSGTTSHREHFQPDAHMRQEDMPNVGETCVTTTWIQLNQSLLALTGEARFAAELERSYYNALSAAQHSNGEDWAYFTPLNGVRKYDSHITCCHSSGPRGMALSAMSAYYIGTGDSSPVVFVNTLESSSARFDIADSIITVEMTSAFPHHGHGTIRVRTDAPTKFAIALRVPAWAAGMKLRGANIRDGWAHLSARLWHDGDTIAFEYDLQPRLVLGQGESAERAYQYWGPFVLAYEPNAGAAASPARGLRYAGAAMKLSKTADRMLRFSADVVDASGHPAFQATLTTFADAGNHGEAYRIWLPIANRT